MSGQPVYAAWHANLQGVVTAISDPVLPGDQIDAAVSCSGSTCWQDIDDVTQNWTSDVSDQVTDGFTGALAAAAGESYDGGVTSSATVVTDATIDGAPISQSDPEADQEMLGNYDGTAGLDPTPLDSTGEDFDFYWNGADGRIVGGATANGSPVDIYDCNGSTGQQWTASNGELINDNSGTCLDATNWDTAAGTQLQIWTCNPGQANQIWTPPT